MSSLRNENAGATIGYRTRGATKVSASTILEVVTEGILTRLLLEDPALSDYAAVIFDEFHERSIHSDLGLAFVLESQGSLRPDLRVLVMSATLEVEKLTRLLPQARLIRCPGRTFPVELRYSPPTPRSSFEDNFSDTVANALRETTGDVLCFLPGKSEIMRVKERLDGRSFSPSIEVLPLAGELALSEQRRALGPLESGRRKVLLATSIAETSLTIDGIKVVVDGGLMRAPRMDHGRGMTELATLPVSQASAIQRMGRAGRQGPGICYRMWSEFTQRSLAPFSTPEILNADCTALLLEVAAWGARDISELSLIDHPPREAITQAQRTLIALGALSPEFQITAHGKDLASIALHPRLGHMVLTAAKHGFGEIACDLAALLEERDVLSREKVDVSMSARWHALDDYRARRGIAGRKDILARADQTSARLKQRLNLKGQADHAFIGQALALAFPEWIAKGRTEGGCNYLLANGSGAALPQGSYLARHRFLAICALDGSGPNARIHLAEPLSESELEDIAGTNRKKRTSVIWDEASGAVRSFSEDCLGALVLRSSPERVTDEYAIPVLLEKIKALGISALPWSKEALSLKDRLFWAKAKGVLSLNLPAFDDVWLLDNLETWLAPFLSGVRSLKDLAKVDLEMALSSQLTRNDLRDLEAAAPAYLELPTGTKAWISYGEHPTISVALQELFGSTKTPAIAGGKVPLTIELLSPAKRPLQVTKDLISFWDTTYPKLRSEMRAKYPRHEWPENPREAPPSRGRKPRKR
jgi:ATP-dependent helicase HrpB